MKVKNPGASWRRRISLQGRPPEVPWSPSSEVVEGRARSSQTLINPPTPELGPVGPGGVGKSARAENCAGAAKAG